MINKLTCVNRNRKQLCQLTINRRILTKTPKLSNAKKQFKWYVLFQWEKGERQLKVFFLTLVGPDSPRNFGFKWMRSVSPSIVHM